MEDITDWLKAERDALAAEREEAFMREDWGTISRLQPRIDRFYEAIVEIERLRSRLASFEDVILRRIILAARAGNGRPGS